MLSHMSDLKMYVRYQRCKHVSDITAPIKLIDRGDAYDRFDAYDARNAGAMLKLEADAVTATVDIHYEAYIYTHVYTYMYVCVYVCVYVYVYVYL